MEIEYEPFKKVKIGEITKFATPEDLGRQVGLLFIRAGQPTVLFWAEGVVFLREVYVSRSEEFARDYKEGTIYWNSVMYSVMPEYKPVVKTKLPDFGNIEIPVVDWSKNKAMREIGKWLRELELE